MSTTHSTTVPSAERRAAPGIVRLGGWAGVVGPVVSVVLVLTQAAGRRDEYDIVAEPMSALGAGELGWVQDVGFVVLGVTTLLFAAGLHRAMAPSRLGVLGPLLLGVTGAGALWAAVFPLARDEEGALYDPGLHWFGGTLFFLMFTVAVIALIPRMRRDPRWRALVPYTAVVAVLVVASVPVMVVLTIPPDAPLHAVVGLNQMLLVWVVRFPWQVTVAARMLRTAEPGARA